MASPSTSGNRARSLSGASALLTRRFTRNSATPRPTTSKSESTATRRRATVDAATSNHQTAHIRIVPNIDNPSRSLIFDIVDRDLEVGSVIKMGRYSERHANIDCMSFKSKVVSRCHCEVWAETDGKVYIRDTKSSSGTFLNHVRLSPGGSESRAVQLNDGDIVQLGVDFQGGREEMYRSVKMKFELNRARRNRPMSFNLTAFQNLRNLRHQQSQSLVEPPTEDTSEQQITTNCINITDAPEKEDTTTPITNPEPTPVNSHEPAPHNDDLEECCICLYALAPFQALFVSPCSHTYHYKCIRPLLKSHPGFQCPICRTYSDLEASVETDEIIENQRPNTVTAPPADSELDLQSSQDQSQVIEDEPEELMEQDHPEPLPVTTSPPDTDSEIVPDAPSLENNNQVIEEPSAEEAVTSNNNNEAQQPKRRERRPSQFMEKLKMVFFEKRKSSSAAVTQQQTKQRKHNNASKNNRQRPLSYPNLLSSADEMPPLPIRTSTSSGMNEGTTSSPLDLSISRQSTSHLEAMITSD